MAIKVKNSNNVGIAPRKIRQVCDLIRNKKGI
jgi:ribosomal protein L22